MSRASSLTPVSIYAEIKKVLRVALNEMVFDVGANVGQSVKEIRTASSLSTVHAFEPIAATYSELVRNVAGDALTHTHRLALSSSTGTARMRATGTQETNAIVADGNEEVPTMRGDDFCEQAKVRSIEYLKIDAEGHDLEVVRGFERMLRSGRVSVVQVEVWLDRKGTPKLDDFVAQLAPEYALWRIINQRGGRRLQYCDAVFARAD